MTRLFGVIGYPVDHSLSPVMHTAAFAALKCDATYGRFEVPVRELRRTLGGLIRAGCSGLNVTVPLKERVIALLDRMDESAAALGAVNTIDIRDGRLIGYNTDAPGFRRALIEAGWKPGKVNAVVLGAGGSARAAAWELSRAVGSRIVIANRHPERARVLARWLARYRPRTELVAIDLARAGSYLSDAAVLVNTTSLGMRPGDKSPVSERYLRRGLLVYDLVYNRTTALVSAARRRGCVAADGRSMLLYQGAESLRIWLKVKPPVAAMARALDAALAGRGNRKKAS